ncbi:MAG: rod shape-determining protein MreC [Candidatus Zixiibacteriota bacterium]|nr:MAG: rod shape-determining protein MreC [candidate division Zixibacteria bacterium]
MEKLSFLIQARKETLLHLSAFVLLSLVLLVLPQSLKSDISGFVFRFSYGPFYALANHIQELEGVREENRGLHLRVMELSLKNFWLNEERLENRRLRELLDFRSELKYKVVPVDLVAAEPNRRRFSVLINKGSEEGIRRNMPVVNMHGLVGKTVDVSPHTSVVQLIIDPSFRASALDRRSRVYGIIRPGPGFTLRLDNVPLTEDVQVGDGVISSGLGGIFPPGIRIGTVTAVESQKTLYQEDFSFGIFKKISVKPSVDISSLEEVFVMEAEKAVEGEEESGRE